MRGGGAFEAEVEHWLGAGMSERQRSGSRRTTSSGSRPSGRTATRSSTAAVSWWRTRPCQLVRLRFAAVSRDDVVAADGGLDAGGVGVEGEHDLAW